MVINIDLPFKAKSFPIETLNVHTEEVWRKFWSFWKRMGVDDPVLEEAIAAAVFVHDFGKAHPKFQEKLKTAGKNSKTTWSHRHEILSAAFLKWFFPPEDSRIILAAAAVLTHHRDLSLLCIRYPPEAPEDWEAPEDKLFDALSPSIVSVLAKWTETIFPLWWEAYSGKPFWGWYQAPTTENFDSWPNESKTFTQTLLELLDRIINSNNIPERKRKSYFISRGTLLLSDRLASASGPDPIPIPWERIVLTLPISLYPHQQQAAKSHGPILLIAPTGSGKTEASLLWANTQHRCRSVNTLLYVLPYQANLNAMWFRFQERYNLSQDEVALWHSRAVLVQFLRLRDKDTEASETAKALHNYAKLMRPSVFLSTPYQLLKTLFSLPGHETLWCLFMNSLIIADEIHSYTPYQSGLFLGLLHELIQSWNVRVCLMTATLPRWMEKFLLEHFCLKKITPDLTLYKRFARHRLYLKRGRVIDQLTHIEAAAYAGEKVLIVVNTVSAAQKLYQTLKEKMIGTNSPNLLLLHSRFIAADRIAKEEQLYKLIEKEQGLIVVATQVVEVSLDVSFDRLYTELAPMEALIQRFGRVNRRGEAPWKPVYVCTRPISQRSPYYPPKLSRHVRVLLPRPLRRIRMLLRPLNGKKLSEDRLLALVQRSYGRVAKKLLKELEQGFSDGKRLIQTSIKPLESDARLAKEYEELFDGETVLPASLLSCYERALEIQPLEAQLYLLYLPEKTLMKLKSQGKAKKRYEEGIWIVDLPYDSENGMII